jgi:hydrogenase nickel incorporation protein HypA/HybF
MHELSIAEAIAGIACAHAGGRRIERVEVHVGHLRQVVPASLIFAFDLVTRGTVAEGADLVITGVPAEGRCRACGADGALPAFPLLCAWCGSADVEVVRGEELLVDALELGDELLSEGRTGHGR